MNRAANHVIKIAPSILSADFSHLADEVRDVLDGGAEYIHVDVMDGMFVPNISIGVPVVKSLRAAFPKSFLDVHLMIERPSRYVHAFADAGASLLMFHVEAEDADGISLAIREAKSLGLKTGLSIKPNTPASVVVPWLDALDMILVMTVEPGFGGQRFIEDQLPKIRELRRMIDQNDLDCDLEVDGGIDRETAPLAAAAGANVFVAGSAIFGKTDRAKEIHHIRERAV